MKKILIFGLACTIMFASCEKQESGGNSPVADLSELNIPKGFTWENSRDIEFDFTIADTRFGNSLHVVSIYDADPSLSGQLLSKGAASVASSFKTKIYLANTIKEVFVVKSAPDNSTTTQRVPISAAKLELKLSAVSKTGADLNAPVKISGISDSPDCTTGCTQTISTSNTNLNISAGQTICVTGSNITIGFNANGGGTIRICGTNVTVQNANLGNNAALIVANGASVNFSSLNLNGDEASFTNYGTSTFSSGFAAKGKVLNENKLITGGDFDLNNNSDFKNFGVVTVGGSMNVNSNVEVINSGSITVAQHFQLNNQSVFVNNCFLWVKGNYNHNSSSTMKNYNLIKVNETTTVNGSSEIGMYNGAMLTTKHMTINARVKGYNGTSLVKVSNNSILNGGGVVDAIQYCDANGIETNNTNFSGGATQGCNLYIPQTNCNTEGNGTAPATDTDNDGVNDSEDAYPTDPTKAFNNFYPSSDGGASVAFEDQWPNKGDYDMNDVVMSYRFKIVTNAQNKVVQVVGNYALEASGGSFNNGFGIEFPIARGTVSDLTGGTLEAGQDNAVIVLFTNMHNEVPNWNTRPGDPVSPPKNYAISFNVNNGPLLSAFGLGSYNPFIWNSGVSNGRGLEVHLPGKTPTKLANTALFGTAHDNTNVAAGRYYVTTQGSPWAINLPIKPFKYPSEASLITSGYLKFQSWAESGGLQNADWYSNTGSGYRNNSFIYNP